LGNLATPKSVQKLQTALHAKAKEGHLNLISGQTNDMGGATTGNLSGVIANGSVIGNLAPPQSQDDCWATKSTTPSVQMTSKNVGDLLNAQAVTWGWFYGDFSAGTTVPAVCNTTGPYNAHYMPFQYYASTANPHHLAPTPGVPIGATDRPNLSNCSSTPSPNCTGANHQYDLTALCGPQYNNTGTCGPGGAIAAGNLPAVTFIKATQSETGHPLKSGPLLEQTFLVNIINALMQSPQWPTMAIFITYDDSDGWYDHVMPPIVNQSNDPNLDYICTGPLAAGAFNDRCGYGTRLPLIVISPWANSNYVDHSVNDLTSILAFIENNWNLGYIDATTPSTPGAGSFDRVAGSLAGLFNFTGPPNFMKLILDPSTGLVVSYGHRRRWS
jgi:phospholipase C